MYTYKAGSLTGHFYPTLFGHSYNFTDPYENQFLEFAQTEWPTNAKIVLAKEAKWLENGQWPAVILHTACHVVI